MRWLESLRKKIATFFRRDAADREMDAELRCHIELHAEDLIRSGVPRDEALRQARLAFGGLDRAKEECRDATGISFLESLWQDVRFGMRQLRRSPRFAAIVILTLALGIAFTTGAFSVAVGVLLNSLPYQGADRIVSFSVSKQVNGFFPMQLPVSQFLALRQSPVLDDAVAWDFFAMSTKFNGLPESVRVGWFTPNAFQFYGVQMLAGTPFADQPLALGAEPRPEAVLSWDYWQSHFGGSTAVVGKSIDLDDRLYTIAGVLPERFDPFYLYGPLDADLYVPLSLKSGPDNVYMTTARLRPDVTPSAAASVLQPLFERFAAETPTHYPKNFRLHLDLLQHEMRNRFGETLFIILAAALVLLAIACLNVSVLVLARGTTRNREFAIRAALGASRGRLFRQLMIESSFFAVAGGCLGVGASYGLLHLLPLVMPSGELPQSAEIQLSIPVLVFAVSVSLASGILFGIAPALRFGFGQGDLKMEFGTRRAAGDRRTSQLHALLMTAQVAATLVMVTAAAVAVTTVLRLYSAPLGFVPKNLEYFDLSLAEGTFATWPARTEYYAELRDEVATLAGVESAALSAFPLPPVCRLIVPIRTEDSGSTGQSATLQFVGSQFFETLRIPLLRGRMWSASEEMAHAANLAVINRSMARQYWPNSDPIGQILTSDGLKSKNAWALGAPTNHGSVQIIGVVGDIPNNGLLKPALPTLYVPYTLLTPDSIHLIVRVRPGFAGGIATEVRRAIARVNGNQALDRAQSAEQRLEEAGWLDQQFLAALFLLFALAAAFLSAIGIYSVVSYSVFQRMKEYGVRMALGASRLDILWISAKPIFRNLVLGLIVGIAMSEALYRLMTHWTEFSSLSAPVLISAIVLVIVVGTFAMLSPAMQACNTKPVDALRLDQ